MRELSADIVIVGGGVGGVAAALAACEGGACVVMTDPYRWIGGQFTSQAVPPDEHPWIETHGATRRYRAFREAVREHYRRYYPLTEAARRDPVLNPGGGWVSPLCHEPRVAHAVLRAMLLPHETAGRLTILTAAVPIAAERDGDHLLSVVVEAEGDRLALTAPYFLEATETGDLLALAGIGHVTGTESQAETGEPSAPETGDTLDMQGVTLVFALDHRDGDHTISRPDDYDRWRDARIAGWPHRLLDWRYPNPRTLVPSSPRFRPNVADEHLQHDEGVRRPDLWSYRRILDRSKFEDRFFASDVSLINWPMNDYVGGAVFGVQNAAVHLAAARALSLSLLYWLQTEAERPDGGCGYPGLALRPDITGTADGLAQATYIREGRRLRAMTTIREQDLSVQVRGEAGAVRYRDSVGTGAYRIDLHPTTGGANYLDLASLPFEIPLGALIGPDARNVIAAGKAIGTTHITNGCYRLHPVEWSIGEAAGSLAAFCLAGGYDPVAVWENNGRLADFQLLLARAGTDLHWHGDERLPG